MSCSGFSFGCVGCFNFGFGLNGRGCLLFLNDVEFVGRLLFVEFGTAMYWMFKNSLLLSAWSFIGVVGWRR